MSDDHDAPVTHSLSADDLVRMNRWVLVASVVRGTVHSVNNILQTIGGQAEMLTQRPDAPDDVRRRMERVIAQTGRAAGYMRELSAVGREIVAAPDRADLRQTIDRVYALRDYDLARERVGFEVRHGEERPPAVRIDRQSLAAILLNLVLNAEQALAGVTDARIVLESGRRNDGVVVSVTDNGPGIPAEDRARIFDPFFTTGRAGATLGLGLAVSRRLAGQHGGRLTLAADASTPGARFELELPAIA